MTDPRLKRAGVSGFNKPNLKDPKISKTKPSDKIKSKSKKISKK